jgi:hypothetical protein
VMAGDLAHAGIENMTTGPSNSVTSFPMNALTSIRPSLILRIISSHTSGGRCSRKLSSDHPCSIV